ncbi:histone-lysine N-methyltransferase 2D-like isoform X2 [Cotesia glomerata]|uniref:histone-lysine N-methyltransferase 2D-like isoform X2 n=1 Tax=Cotesia glomerata TaxID=32391 RepID=UPI001D00B524|nr:histone-lysine N-methyltransferase 2D-like isoform X2 [Cotesia glomerata]
MSVSVYLFSKLLIMTLIINKVSSACTKVKNEDMIEYSCENGTLADLYSIPERTEKIRIANIDLSHLTADTFGRFGDDLWVLSCSHCSIQEIDDDAFKTLTSLQQLRLDNNNLRAVKAQWFQGLKYLTYLDFNYNEIESIEDGVFANLPGLVDLRIAGNKLQCLNVDEMSHLVDLKRVFLNRNPEFKCPNAVNQLMQSKNINYERDDAWDKITHDLIQPKSAKLLSKVLESVTETLRIYDRPESGTEDPRSYERPEDPRIHEIPESRKYDPRVHGRPEDPRIHEKPEDPRIHERPEDSRIHERPEDPRIHEIPESRTYNPRVHGRPEDSRIHERPEDPRIHEIPDSRTYDPKIHERPEDPRIHEIPESRTYDPRIHGRPEDPRIHERPDMTPDDPRIHERPEDPRIHERPEDPRIHEIPESRTYDPRIHGRPEDPRIHERPEDPRIHERPNMTPEDPRIHERPEDPRIHERPEDPRISERPENPRIHELLNMRPEDPRIHEILNMRPEDPRIHEILNMRPEDPRLPEILESLKNNPRLYEPENQNIYDPPESITDLPTAPPRPDEESRNHPRPELMTEPPKIYQRFDLTNPPEVYENYETTPMYRERLIITHNSELPSSTSNINYPVTSMHYPTSVTYPDKSDTYSRPEASRNFPEIPTPPVSVPQEPYYPRSSTFAPYSEVNAHRLPTSTSKISWTSNSEDINTFDDIYYPIEADPLSREDNHNINYPEPGHNPTRPFEHEKEVTDKLASLPLGNPHTLENYQQVDEMPPVTIFTAEEQTNGPVTTTTDKPLPSCSSSSSIGFGGFIAILCFAVSHSILRTI